MEPRISAEISSSAGEESEMSTNATTRSVQVDKVRKGNISTEEEKTLAVSASGSPSNHGSGSSIIQGEEPVSTKEAFVADLYPSKVDRGRKSSAQTKLSGKKKGKVDWTPELHKKFVQAVEQLGVDKAVPSKILELMGVDCLTRHNVASHLQKYRSHRKHMLAREAEVATWSRKRQLYRNTRSTGTNDANSWVVPTTGFPPVTSMSRSRPFHVWGHPSPNQPLVYMWPGHHLASSPSPPWAAGHPPLPHVPRDPSFWNYHHQDVPAPGMVCYPSHFPQPTFATPPVPGLSPSSIYSAAPSIGVPVTVTGQKMVQPALESHLQSAESIDAVIGDVLSKPWQPLPLGLKPPSVDSVVVELQRQGISKIPPTCA